MRVTITKSEKKDKKFQARVGDKTIHFGAAGMSDYTIHKDPQRKQRYLDRHRKREDWSKVDSAGFMSRNLLWNKPTLKESIADLNARYKGIDFVLKTTRT